MPSKRDSQYLSLPVAAHLARTKLVPDPVKVYDAQHLNEMLNVVASALARTTRLFVKDPQTGALRELSAVELDGSIAQRGATRLMLKDGSALSGVIVLRDELLDAIAVLRAAGVPELRMPAGAPPAPAANQESQDPRAMLAEIEKLLQPPLLHLQLSRVSRLAVALARSSKRGEIANLAMRLISALHDTYDGESTSGIGVALARLRAALGQEEKLR